MIPPEKITPGYGGIMNNILERAAELVHGDRQQSYGSPGESFAKIAAGWSEIFDVPVTARQVCLAMMWLKIVREANRHKTDNLVDIAGYAWCAEECEQKGGGK